jgi:type III secretory pathway component EscT
LLQSLQRQGGTAILLFARALGCFAFLPAFAARSFPVQVRAAIPIAILPIVLATAGSVPGASPALSWSILPLVVLEFALGVALSLPACVLFWAARGAGEMIDIQTGANNQEVFTAMTNGADGPAAQLFTQLALLGFLSAGGLHELVRTLWASYPAIGPGGATGLDTLAAQALAAQLLGMVVVLALKVCMPMVAVFLLLELALAVTARAMPQLPVPAISAALKSLLLPLVLLVVLQAFGDYLQPPSASSLDVLRLFRTGPER